MAKPWFRRWMGFGYVPINWQGWSVLVTMLITFVPFAALFLMLNDDNRAASWICAVIGAISALIGHAVIVWKLDRNYGS